ncbi:hypothetical protein LUZ60_015346 [Juncus effusus]|nr:hypothetical protein LUZ60_015346 [Juncus effusus]
MTRVRVYLTIGRIENVNLEEGHSLMVEIGWIGRNTKFRFPGKRIERNCTSVQSIRDGGNLVQWNEVFQHSVKLRWIDQGCYKSWFINLEVHETVGDSKTKIAIAPKARIDIAEDIVLGTERIISISLDCQIRGNPITATLEAKLQIIKNWSESGRSLSLPKSMSFRIFSCIGGQRHRRHSYNARPGERVNDYMSHEFSLSRVRNRSVDGSSSDDEPEPSYKKLQLYNYLINQFNSNEEDDDDSIDGSHAFSPNVEILSSNSFDRRQTQNQSPLQRLLSLKRLISFKKNDQPKGKPLLNKSCCDIGGDDIDIERHEESGRSKVHPDTLRDSVFDKDEPFEIGSWERRSFFSRDSELVLVTDAFLATIDQRSERASGGSACTVLAVVIADWLYKNPGYLPLRCEMDQLVRDGSIIWRDLCRDANHRERFSDQHFDLETVLREGIVQLREEVDLSYLGFFRTDEPQESLVFLKELPSFDSIWVKMILDDLGLTERVYICSWNDHFFVLKIERDVIYLIDTFGERLFEGCNQAYILKFDKDSVIYGSFEEMIIDESKLEMNKETNEKENNSKQENDESKLEMNKETKEKENNNNKQENGESKLKPKEEDKNNKEENSENKLEMHKESKHEENNNKQANGYSNEKENNNKEDEHATIQEDKINSSSVDGGIKIEQEKINHSLTNGAICEKKKYTKEEIEEVKCPTEKIEKDQGNEIEPCSPREGNCERVESSKVVICEGLESCREYIKGFLASLPLRQLQEDLVRGSIREETIPRRLQIEFHYVVPS